MELTLWRGSTRWGALLIHQQTPKKLSALLLPDPDAVGIVGLFQNALGEFPGNPVFQYPLHAYMIGAGEDPNPEGPRLSALEAAVDADTPPPVSHEDVLRFVGEDGRELPAWMISVLETQAPSGTAVEAFASLPPHARRGDSIWEVIAAFDTHATLPIAVNDAN